MIRATRFVSICALALSANARGEVRILTANLEPAARELPYHASIDSMATNRCESNDVALSLAGGDLPKGLEITQAGIAGTPRETGTFRFRLKAANACSSDVRELELLVTTRPMLSTNEQEIVLKTGAPAANLLVYSNRPDVPYSVETRGAPWLTARPDRGRTPDAESALAADRVQLAADPAGLKPGVYSGTLLVSTWGGANIVKVRVTLIVVSS